MLDRITSENITVLLVPSLMETMVRPLISCPLIGSGRAKMPSSGPLPPRWLAWAPSEPK
jgi:hypothetical protein